MSDNKGQVVYDIVERHLIAFDPDLTFDQNGMDSMAMVNIMVDIESELGVDLMAMAADPQQRIPETVQELECIVLEKLMRQNAM